MMRPMLLGTYGGAFEAAVHEDQPMPEEIYIIETEETADGRWIAKIIDFPQLPMAYGQTEEDAVAERRGLRELQELRGTSGGNFGNFGDGEMDCTPRPKQIPW